MTTTTTTTSNITVTAAIGLLIFACALSLARFILTAARGFFKQRIQNSHRIYYAKFFSKAAISRLICH